MNHRINFRLAILIAGMVASPISAHGIGVEVKRAGDRLTVEAFFDDDSPAADAVVKVYGESDEVAVEGKADAAGRWSCPVPKPGTYRVVVEAPGGHRTRKAVTIGADSAIEGPTRGEFTGPAKWWRAAGGVGALLFALLIWLRSHRIGVPPVLPAGDGNPNPPANC